MPICCATGGKLGMCSRVRIWYKRHARGWRHYLFQHHGWRYVFHGRRGHRGSLRCRNDLPPIKAHPVRCIGVAKLDRVAPHGGHPHEGVSPDTRRTGPRIHIDLQAFEAAVTAHLIPASLG